MLVVVVIDVCLFGCDGLVVLCEMLWYDCQLFVIFIIGYGDVMMVVVVMCVGVYDFMEKLFYLECFVDVVWCVLEKCWFMFENLCLCEVLQGWQVYLLIGQSVVMQNVCWFVIVLVLIDVDIFVMGEIGLGKEVFVCVIYEGS